MQSHPVQTVDVEVVEIDGVAPVTPRPDPMPHPERANPWQGRVVKLGGRWGWLWFIPALIIAAVVLTGGLIVAVVMAVVGLIARIVRAVLSGK